MERVSKGDTSAELRLTVGVVSLKRRKALRQHSDVPLNALFTPRRETWRDAHRHGSHKTASNAMEACLAIMGSALSCSMRMAGRHPLSSFNSTRMSAKGKQNQRWNKGKQLRHDNIDISESLRGKYYQNKVNTSATERGQKAGPLGGEGKGCTIAKYRPKKDTKHR